MKKNKMNKVSKKEFYKIRELAYQIHEEVVQAYKSDKLLDNQALMNKYIKKGYSKEEIYIALFDITLRLHIGGNSHG